MQLKNYILYKNDIAHFMKLHIQKILKFQKYMLHSEYFIIFKVKNKAFIKYHKYLEFTFSVIQNINNV